MQLGVSPAVYAYGERTLETLRERFAAVDAVAEYNQAKVIAAMQKNRVGASCFAATTGYGYDDVGRDVLEKVYADTFHTEAALVRPQITCGTHALAVTLFGLLRPGQNMLAAAGRPYDTLESVIGIEKKVDGSLADWGVGYGEVELIFPEMVRIVLLMSPDTADTDANAAYAILNNGAEAVPLTDAAVAAIPNWRITNMMLLSAESDDFAEIRLSAYEKTILSGM